MHGLVDGSEMQASQQSTSVDDDGPEPIDGPELIIRSQAGHEIRLGGFDLLMIAVVLGLTSSTIVTLAQATGG